MIFTVPALLPVTTPEELTEATALFAELHVTVLSVALEGDTVAVRVTVLPTSTVAVDGETDTAVTGISAGLPTTSTMHVAFIPFSVIAVITVSPIAKAVIRPLSTVATADTLELQRIFLFTAPEG